jgi:TIR domain-containing protein
MPHDVFISHSAKDKVTADAVCAVLEGEGIRCWIAPRDVLPSMEWGEAIIEAIEECRLMVLVFTANANESPQIRREVERAVNRGVAILPVRIEDVLPGKGLEYFIGNVHWLDALNPPLEAHLKSLAGTIKIVLARNASGTPPIAPGVENPPSNIGRRSELGTLDERGKREAAPAPRRFWGTRAWTWAGGAVSVLLLGAVFIGGRFIWGPAAGPAPVGLPAPMPEGAPSPGSAPLPTPMPTPGAPKAAKPSGAAPGGAGNNAALQDTMRTLQGELNSIGTVSFTAFNRDTANGSASQYAAVNRVSNVVADPGQCRVSYHWTVWRNGASQPIFDKGFSFLLHDVTSVDLEPVSQVNTESNAAGGHPNLVQTSTAPPMTALVVKMSSRRNYFPFANGIAAGRAAQTIDQAVQLCGGTVTN